MGGIVKSIGRTLKKLGKSVGKFLKKYGTTIILAAAVWAGLGAFGAASSGASIWSPSSVSHGVQRIFGFGAYGKETVGGIAKSVTDADWFDVQTGVKKFTNDVVESKSVLSGIGKWLGGLKDWQKYALTQSAMTMAGSLLDTSAEDEWRSRNTRFGIPPDFEGDPTAIFDEHPEWAVPAPPNYGAGSWPQVPAAARTMAQTPAVRQAMVGLRPREQQIAQVRTTPLDVRSPGMISNRAPGLISSGSSQRRVA